MKVFRAPKESLGDLDADAAAMLIATAADVALVLDGDGVIKDLSFQRTDLAAELEGYGRLLGRRWGEIVVAESEPKVETLLREAAATKASAWRQVDHPTTRGIDVPILYSVVNLGVPERYVAVGRDQRAVAALQQRLVEAQMSMERDYSRLRHVETRYRILFQVSSEPVLIVDARTGRIVEANPRALDLCADTRKRLVGRALTELFDSAQGHVIQNLMAGMLTGGRAQEATAKLAGHDRPSTVSALLFRQDAAQLVLVRIVPQTQDAATPLLPPPRANLLRLAESAPDGFVVTDARGRILACNRTFADMAQLASAEQAQGEMLDRWLGRVSVDLNILIASLREHGAVRLFATILRVDYDNPLDVEVSGAVLPESDPPAFGFAIRNVGRRIATEPAGRKVLPRSVEQLTELIGRVPLKDLVRETTDVIERLCIEAALNLTGDNRASAAEMLGLSRQSLYVKLRRYGFADLSVEGDDRG